VDLRVVPEELRPWELYGIEAVVRPDLVKRMEVDGLIEVQETADGSRVPDGDRVAVPFINLSVRHSCIESVTNTPVVVADPGDRVQHRFENPCPTSGWCRIRSTSWRSGSAVTLPIRRIRIRT
jgi:hypothetical protein